MATKKSVLVKFGDMLMGGREERVDISPALFLQDAFIQSVLYSMRVWISRGLHIRPPTVYLFVLSLVEQASKQL